MITTNLLPIFAILVIASLPVPAAELDIGAGGISSDKLGGVGGSKSVLAISASACAGWCYAGRAWRVIEQMDDDAGIVPESGWSAEVSTAGPWFIGARYDGLPNLMLGARFEDFEAALLVPSSNGRFGFTSRLRTQGRQFGFLRYEYTGTQDPDTKDSLVVVGVGFEL